MFKRLFLEHPRSVGESYLEHQRRALGFGVSLFFAALACLIHALIPGLFVRTGSDAITRLHDRMVAHRIRKAADPGPSHGNAGVTAGAGIGPVQGSAPPVPAGRRFT